MPFEGDPLAFRGHRIIHDYRAKLEDKVSALRIDPDRWSSLDISDPSLRFLPSRKVGILGAGIGGLYTALILDSLDIDYEILESSGRAGGRLSTYKFSGGNKYDYYEAGAMRFPLPKRDDQGQYKDGVMKRLAELTDYPPLNKNDPLSEKLIPYYYTARNGSGFYYFNGVRQSIAGQTKGSFRAEDMGVTADYVKAGADEIGSDVVKPFVKMLIKDMQEGGSKGWQVMMANDTFSTRAYMSAKYIPSSNLDLPPAHLPNNVITWCSLLGGSSGGYDRALAEGVFSAMEFAKVGGTDYGDVDWKCFEGGSETLSKKIEEYINGPHGDKKRIIFNHRVTAIRQHDWIVDLPKGRVIHPRLPQKAVHSDNVGPNSRHLHLPSEAEETDSDSVHLIVDEDTISNPGLRQRFRIPAAAVEVSIHGHEPRVYSHVISTLPLSVLRTIDLKGADLNVNQKNALRQLQYGPSIKIAIRFLEPWWTKELGIVGGQSFTDLPIRTIVYPSYGVDSDTPSTVLIASYCWTTDASRLSALAAKEQEEVLKELVLRNLAEAHGGPITYEFLHKQFVAMHVKDWDRDAHTMGAFAFFGPGDFQDLYTSLSYPAANKRLHFAGEALSTRHAWVVGALDSAWRAVYEYLKVTHQTDKMDKFKELWGNNAEWTTEPGKPDLLDMHLGLVSGAILAGEIVYSG